MLNPAFQKASHMKITATSSFKRLTAKLMCSVFLLSASTAPVLACTTFRIQAQDGSWITGRSMEFGINLDSKLMVVPVGYELAIRSPDFKVLKTFKAKVGFVGLSTLGFDISTDGINEAGLSANALFIPGFVKYPAFDPKANQPVDNLNLVNWILSSFKTVAEVREALPSVNVFTAAVPQLGDQPLHWSIRDAQGASIVVEYVDGKLNIHDNPLGVLTNSPNFDWHMTNLRNYSNLTSVNVDGFKLGSVQIDPIGQGSGLMGLPGDYTPPSRFVRVTALAYTALQPKTTDESINLAFHILNAVDIPKGAVAARTPAQNGQPASVEYDYTQWVTVYDLNQRVAFYRTYGDLNIKKLDLKKTNFTGDKITYIPLSNKLVTQDLTPK